MWFQKLERDPGRFFLTITDTLIVSDLTNKGNAHEIRIYRSIVILAVRWEQAKQALAEVSDWNGRILVDATNRPLAEDSKGESGSEIIASHAPGPRPRSRGNRLHPGGPRRP